MNVPIATVDAATVLAEARALKERCYAAWNSDPAEAQRCARASATLVRSHAGAEVAVEVEALGHWTAAIAAIATGEFALAIDRLDRAHSAFESAALPADAAQTQIPKIMALSLLGRFDEAAVCALAARNALVAQGDLRSAAKVVLNMGSLCYSQDRYAQAAEHYLHAAVWFARAGDREHSVLADLGRGDALSFLGDLDEAEALYRRAAQRAAAHGLHVISSSATQALAELALVRGNYRDALAGLAAASRNFAALELPVQRREAERALADAYAELNLGAEAEALYAEIAGALDEPAAKAWLGVQRARLAAQRGQNEVAGAALEQAQAFFDAMDNRVGRAEVALARATLAMHTGLWEEARAYAAGAFECLGSLGLPGHHAALALAMAELGDGARERARDRLEALLADGSTPLPVRERAWLWLGRARLAGGQTHAARDAFDNAVELSEIGLGALPTVDVQRAYLDARADGYEELLRLDLTRFDREPGVASAGAVFAALERLRARTLRLQLASSRQPGAPTDRVSGAVEDAERERLDWIYRRSTRHLHRGTDEPPPAGLDAERQALESRIVERQRRAKVAASPVPQGTGAVGFDALRLGAQLGSKEALVAYGLLDGEVFAVSLRDGVVAVHRRLARREELARTQRALHTQLQTQRLGTPHLARHGALLNERARRCLGTLYELLWQPLEPVLHDVEDVRIVPSASFGSVPFAALWDGASHLVERLGVSLLASASTLDNAPAPRIERVLLAADTETLEGGRAELDALAQVWRGASVLDGAGMTRAALCAAAPHADLLHVACHGEFRPDNPLFSALLLADGVFTAMDIERLQLRRRPIVVLSACDTALADPARGDEALGLVRAFLIAGASRVIATLWQVDDANTAASMCALHREMHRASASPDWGARSVSQVLTRVQRRGIADGAHPYLWAGFCLHGGH